MKIKSFIPDYKQPIIKKYDKLSNKHQSFANLIYSKTCPPIFPEKNKEDKNA